MSIDTLLKRNFTGVATNQFGEGVLLGKPKEVRHLKYGYSMTWDIVKSEHKSPFDTLVLNEGTEILQVIPTKLFRMDGRAKTLTLHLE